MPKLILKERGKESEQAFDFQNEDIVLGRADVSSLILESQGVSREHAKIFPKDKDFYIIDLGSLGGTKLNGMLIPKNEKYILKHNDIISIDKYDVRFQLIDEMLSQSFNDITDSDILEVKLLKKVLRALDRESIPSIEVLNGVAEGKKAFLTEDITELSIGRDPMNDFPIEEYIVSRDHAKIVRKWGGIIIQDLESKNGVYVNSKKVTEEFLHDGDRIALGTIVLIFRNPNEIDLNELGKEMTKEKKESEANEAVPDAEPSAEDNGKETESTMDGDEEEVSFTGKALPEEEEKALVDQVEQKQYPTPHKKKERIKFSAMELTFVGLGVLVFLFAIIMIVRIIFS